VGEIHSEVGGLQLRVGDLPLSLCHVLIVLQFLCGRVTL